jgi:hypothetical protein
MQIEKEIVGLMLKRHTVGQWLKHYATSLNVAGSRPDEVYNFFSSYLILPTAL